VRSIARTVEGYRAGDMRMGIMSFLRVSVSLRCAPASIFVQAEAGETMVASLPDDEYAYDSSDGVV